MRTALAALLLLAAAQAEARPGRPRFEPNDLELEKPGVLDLDFQAGYIAAATQSRVVLPDFEIDIGLLKNFELDLDGTYALDPHGDSLPDNLWLSGKVGAFAVHWENGLVVSGGLQAGPRLAVAHGASGVGVDALVLLGFARGRTHLVLNAGGYYDPVQVNQNGVGSARPAGVQLGVDLDIDLTRDGRWSFNGSAGAVIALAVDPSQVVLTAGVTFSPKILLWH